MEQHGRLVNSEGASLHVLRKKSRCVFLIMSIVSSADSSNARDRAKCHKPYVARMTTIHPFANEGFTSPPKVRYSLCGTFNISSGFRHVCQC